MFLLFTSLSVGNATTVIPITMLVFSESEKPPPLRRHRPKFLLLILPHPSSPAEACFPFSASCSVKAARFSFEVDAFRHRFFPQVRHEVIEVIEFPVAAYCQAVLERDPIADAESFIPLDDYLPEDGVVNVGSPRGVVAPITLAPVRSVRDDGVGTISRVAKVHGRGVGRDNSDRPGNVSASRSAVHGKSVAATSAIK